MSLACASALRSMTSIALGASSGRERCTRAHPRMAVGAAELVRDDREELVLQPAGLLGLRQDLGALLLEALLIVDVGAGAEPAEDAPCLVTHRQRAAQEPAVCAVGAPEAVLDLVVFPRLDGALPPLPGALLIVRVQLVVPAGAVRARRASRRYSRTSGGCRNRDNRRAASTRRAAASCRGCGEGSARPPDIGGSRRSALERPAPERRAPSTKDPDERHGAWKRRGSGK